MIDIFMVHHTTAFIITIITSTDTTITTIMIIKINNEFRFFTAPNTNMLVKLIISNSPNLYQQKNNQHISKPSFLVLFP